MCPISNKKIKFEDLYMKMNPPWWIAADFKCRNLPVVDSLESHKLYINKSVAIGFNLMKSSKNKSGNNIKAAIQ